jgi:hypothetical protein
MLKDEKTTENPQESPKEPVPKKKSTGDLFCCKSCGEISGAVSSAYPGFCVKCGLEQGAKDSRKPYEGLKGAKGVEIFALDFHEVPSSYDKGAMIDLDQDMDGKDGAVVDNMILKVGNDYVEVRYRDTMGIGDKTSIVLTNHGSCVPEKKGTFWYWPEESHGH